ncbi:hypothetical protein [Vagococcus carniphilus]|uniref:hypothetical protein n=1 Tax=Vagococcus carniphilus TaxID=218144 RepID=UPI003BA8E31B
MKKRFVVGLSILMLVFVGFSHQEVIAAGSNKTVTVKEKPQGSYISDGSYVQVTKKNYQMWQSFNWKKRDNSTRFYGKTFKAKGHYKHRNGETYYSLYDYKDNWYGYLNSKATKKIKAQGNYISDGRYVKITKNNYDMWQNFSWKRKNKTTTVYGKTFKARGRYEHFNRSTYYSLYDNNGKWYGYLNAKATRGAKEVIERRDVTVKVDQTGKKITETTGYVFISKTQPVLTVTREKSKTIHTYTVTESYRKVANKDIEKTVNVDQDGQLITEPISEYDLVSEGEVVKTIEKISNGDTTTTYTKTNIYRSKDPIIKNILKNNDPRVMEVANQVGVNNTRVSIRQAEVLSRIELNNKVAEIFTDMVNQERRLYKKPMIQVTKDEKAKKEIAMRAVEVMYQFSHTAPSNMKPDEQYWLERSPGETEMRFGTENISEAYIVKSIESQSSDNLARDVAKGMFSQYIESERKSAHSDEPYSNENGHYRNIIMTDHSDIVVAVYLVDNSYSYHVSTAVATGTSFIEP